MALLWKFEDLRLVKRISKTFAKLEPAERKDLDGGSKSRTSRCLLPDYRLCLQDHFLNCLDGCCLGRQYYKQTSECCQCIFGLGHSIPISSNHSQNSPRIKRIDIITHIFQVVFWKALVTETALHVAIGKI